VFGTREDLKRVFGSDVIHLFQIGLKGDISDADAVTQLREVMKGATGSTAMVVGSGREIKQSILSIGTSTMRIATIIAIGAMLIGCAGVTSIVVAGIDARRFQFGVVRSVGAGRGLLMRLIVGEVLIVALTACVLGTMLGLQGSWAGIRLYEMLAGLELHLRPPLAPIALGWAILLVLTLLAVAPAVVNIARTPVRTLLAAGAN